MSIEKVQAKIEKRGSEFCVVSKEGKSLGCYPTREAALKRLRQVEFHKNKGTVNGVIASTPLNLRKVEASATPPTLDEAQSLIDKFTITQGD
jgi:hypothetical protein